jgi:hypothetical protein
MSKDTDCCKCGTPQEYDEKLKAWVLFHITGVGYLCKKCKARWDHANELCERFLGKHE